jgi:endoglucanase
MIILPSLSGLTDGTPGSGFRNTRPPSLLGITTENETLTIDVGTYVPNATNYAFRWFRDDVELPVSSNQGFFTLGAPDIGTQIHAEVTATYKTYSITLLTPKTPAIKAASPPATPPVNIVQPAIVNPSPRVGTTLHANYGQWSGYPAPDLTGEWYRDGAPTGNTTQDYLLELDDLGTELFFRVEAENTEGTETEDTDTVGPIVQQVIPGQFLLGLNTSGGEYGNPEDGYEILMPTSLIDELASKNITSIRHPLNISRVQSYLGAPIDAGYMSRLATFRDYCVSKGVDIIWDFHNFGYARTSSPISDTPINQTTFNSAAVSGGSPGTTGFTEDTGSGDHNLQLYFTAPAAGTILITVRAKLNPAYTGNGNFKFNVLAQPTTTEAGFRWSDGVQYAGNTTGTASAPDADGYRTFTLPANVAPGLITVALGAGASSGAYDGNHYIGTAGQQPFLLASVTVTYNSTPVLVSEVIGTGNASLAHFTDTWRQFVAFWRSTPNGEAGIRGYDLMNEPASQTADSNFALMQAGINGVRQAGSTLPIYIEGIPYSGARTFWQMNPNLHRLVDPANNLIFSAHVYGDWNSGGFDDLDELGGTFNVPMQWEYNVLKGLEEGPPGTTVDEDTIVNRLRPFVEGCIAHGVRWDVGELGVGNDNPGWNEQLRRAIAYAQDNDGEIHVWSSGPAWGNYVMRLNQQDDPIQTKQMAVFDEVLGNPSPTTYDLVVPARRPYNVTPVTSVQVKVRYNGIINTPITFTLSDNGGGGSFSPATLTTNVDENWEGTTTYTFVADKNLTISATNNRGLTNPAPKPLSTYIDIFSKPEASGDSAGNIFSVWRRIYKSYTGPLVRLYRTSDGTSADIGFHPVTDLLDRTAEAAFIAGGGTIYLEKVYDQNWTAKDLTTRQYIEGTTGTQPVVIPTDLPLWISDAGDGFPAIRWTGTTQMDFEMSMLNRDDTTVMQLIRHTSGPSVALNWTFFNQFAFGTALISSRDSQNLDMGVTAGLWTHLAATRERNTVSGLRGWNNGELVASANTQDVPIQQTTDYRPQCSVGYYRFTPGTNLWRGDHREIVTFNSDIDDDIVQEFWDDVDATYGISTPPGDVWDPDAPDIVLDFRDTTITIDGVAGTWASHVAGTLTASDPTKGVRFSPSHSKNVTFLDVPNGIYDALRSDKFTMRFYTREIVGSTQFFLTFANGAWYFYNNAYFVGHQPGTATQVLYNGDMGLPANKTLRTPWQGSFNRSGVSILSVGGAHVGEINTTANAATGSIGTVGFGTATGSDTDYWLEKIEIWRDTAPETVVEAADATVRLPPVPANYLDTWYSGVNFAGLDFGFKFAPQAGAYSDYWRSKGINFIRLPFEDEAWGGTLASPNINASYFSTYGIDSWIDEVTADGFHVLLDLHQYASFKGGTVTDAGDMVTGFPAAWALLADRYKANPRVHIDLMNEPVGVSSLAAWVTVQQNCVTAIRATGFTGIITITGDGYSNALSFNTGGGWDSLLTITDPEDNLVYQGHMYLDPDFSGAGGDMGVIRYKYEALQYVRTFAEWARYHGKRFLIGEFGTPYASGSYPDMTREFRWMMELMYENRDAMIGYAYWGAGGRWGNGYLYTCDPDNLGAYNQTDKSQVATFQLYPGYAPSEPAIEPEVPDPTVTITPGTQYNVSNIAGNLTNVYQLNLRIDPTNGAKMLVTGKSPAEGNTVIFSTSDTFTTVTREALPSTGDPDSAFDHLGNAYRSYIDYAAGCSIQKRNAGSSTWNTKVSVADMDHPHVIVDRNASSPYYGRIYFAGRGSNFTCFRSSDTGSTWSRADLTGTTKFNNGFVFGGCVHTDGTVYFAYKSAQTISVVNGSYGGSSSDFYIMKSTDGGATFTPCYIFTTTPIQTQGAGGYYGCSNPVVSPNGRVHVVINQAVANAPCRNLYFYSDDAGVTWSVGAPIGGSLPDGYGAGSPSFAINAAGVIYLQYFGILGNSFRIYAIASKNNGDTWSDPVQISSATSTVDDDSNQDRAFGQDQVHIDVAPDGAFWSVWTNCTTGNSIYAAYARRVVVT